MKTALSFLALVLMVIFLIFLNTLSYQKPHQNHPPPKSTRILSPSSKANANPFPTLQSSARKLTDEELRSAIKAEWAKLNNRPNNRDLPKIVSLLHEFGSRKDLAGLEFLESLPKLRNENDLDQARKCIIVGWSHSQPKSAFQYIWIEDKFKALSHGSGYQLFFATNSLGVLKTEVKKSWLAKDKSGFLEFLESSKGKLSHSEFAELSKDFPQISPSATVSDPFGDLKVPEITTSSIAPRFETVYRQMLPGQEAGSLHEWAAKNQVVAEALLEQTFSSERSNEWFVPSDHLYVIAGIAFNTGDIQAILQRVPPDTRFETTQELIQLNSRTWTEDELWPIDGKPSPWQRTRNERLSSLTNAVEQDESFTAEQRTTLQKQLTFIILGLQ